MSIFKKNSGKGYYVWKKFQIGSVILTTQMANRKKNELIDDFDLAWTKNLQFFGKFLENGSHLPQNSPQNSIWETSIRHNNSEKGPAFW